MEVRHEAQEAPRGLRIRLKRYRILLTVLVAALLLPAFLSPTHPIAVYGYLFDTYVPPLMVPVAAAVDDGLTDFLIRPDQLDRYRDELFADFNDERGGKLFVIIREPGGALRYAPIRTWNSFLPEKLPSAMSRWLDRKELPYLGDSVDLWMKGNEIVAVGHYHPYGGGPSPGDQRAQSFSKFAEVVVSNGIVPMVYLHGEIIPYGNSVKISNSHYRTMRTLERGFLMEIKEIEISPAAPSIRFAAFLAYLRDYRNVDLADDQQVASEVRDMCATFKRTYAEAFTKGFRPFAYREEPDKLSMLKNLSNVELWAAGAAYFRNR